jgi:hypothetical protein
MARALVLFGVALGLLLGLAVYVGPATAQVVKPGGGSGGVEVKTTATLPAANASEGKVVYDSTVKKVKVSNGSAWEQVVSGARERYALTWQVSPGGRVPVDGNWPTHSVSGTTVTTNLLVNGLPYYRQQTTTTSGSRAGFHQNAGGWQVAQTAMRPKHFARVHFADAANLAFRLTWEDSDTGTAAVHGCPGGVNTALLLRAGKACAGAINDSTDWTCCSRVAGSGIALNCADMGVGPITAGVHEIALEVDGSGNGFCTLNGTRVQAPAALPLSQSLFYALNIECMSCASARVLGINHQELRHDVAGWAD